MRALDLILGPLAAWTAGAWVWRKVKRAGKRSNGINTAPRYPTTPAPQQSPWAMQKTDRRFDPGTYSYQSRALLTRNEIEFWTRLTRALPQAHVFPQVAMSALIEPRNSRFAEQNFRRIAGQRVDFAIYDQQFNILCVIELDDPTHDEFKDRQRDARLQSAGIRCVRFEARSRPDFKTIRARVYGNQPARTDIHPNHPDQP
ncbi:DUF2726 domain-containing protein [Paraburkholderia sp. GAS32]|uniref:DUF2726 domain-containing protein n=1 Tax=Paraburkholderia sp. GAS32 TaxID=3035129 RepID=UPI003D22B0AE